MKIKISDGFRGVVSVSLNHKTIFTHASGYQDLVNEIPNTYKTRFASASAGKIFVAVAILQLIEKGVIQFNSTLEELIPIDWNDIDPKITVLQLLTHTSGIPDYFDESVMDNYSDLWQDFPNYNIRKTVDLFIMFLNKPMMYEKGTKFQYNNTGYVVLGRIIEIVSQQPFDEYLRNNVFMTANMHQTGYFELDRLPKQCANHYIWDEAYKQYYTNIYSVDAKGSGAGGAYTTAQDIESFWKALLSYQLLSKTMTEHMLTVHIKQEQNDLYGLGVWFNGESITAKQPYVTGYDTGVSFVSEYNRNNDCLITILSNYGDDVWEECYSIKKQLKQNKDNHETN